MTNSKSIPDNLNQVLSDCYALMALCHLAHWNVEGKAFYALHKDFQKQYEALFEAIDEIAERIRALDAYAIGGLSVFARTTDLEEFTSPLSGEEYVSKILAGHEKLIANAAKTRDLAGEAGDAETEGMMSELVGDLQKTTWMLKSYLK